jgi:hypothetical protein
MTRNQRPTAYRSARPCVMRTHASMQMQIRIVSELCHIRPSNPDEERHLRRHTGAHRCCAKSLIKTALVGFRVRQHARTESISKRAPWRKAAVHRTGACRRTDRERDPAHVGCLQRPSGQRVDAGSCEQSGVCQSVAGIPVAEKNRCLRISAPGAWTGAVRHQSSGLAETISGTIEGQSAGA